MNAQSLLLAHLVALLLCGLIATPLSHAQQADMTVGVGGQIGDPSGLSFKFYERPDLSFDILLALDINQDFVFLNIHRTWEEPLRDGLRYFYGPGLVIGVDSNEQPPRQNQVLTGISFTGGLSYFIDRFDVFINLTPRLRVLPATRGRIGGGGGLRYYF